MSVVGYIWNILKQFHEISTGTRQSFIKTWVILYILSLNGLGRLKLGTHSRYVNTKLFAYVFSSEIALRKIKIHALQVTMYMLKMEKKNPFVTHGHTCTHKTPQKKKGEENIVAPLWQLGAI